MFVERDRFVTQLCLLFWSCGTLVLLACCQVMSFRGRLQLVCPWMTSFLCTFLITILSLYKHCRYQAFSISGGFGLLVLSAKQFFYLFEWRWSGKQKAGASCIFGAGNTVFGAQSRRRKICPTCQLRQHKAHPGLGEGHEEHPDRRKRQESRRNCREVHQDEKPKILKSDNR